MTETLPMLKVQTMHSEYLIDQENGRFTRTRVHEDANVIRQLPEGEWQSFSEGYMQTGQRMMLQLGDDQVLYSTPVVSIEEVTE